MRAPIFGAARAYILQAMGIKTPNNRHVLPTKSRPRGAGYRDHSPALVRPILRMITSFIMSEDIRAGGHSERARRTEEPAAGDHHDRPRSPPTSARLNVVPALIADLGDEAAWRYVEFFTANIRNPHTRRAYARACSRFFVWCEDRGLTPAAIRPLDVAAYIEQLQDAVSAPSVKQQLAAVRMLFDWLVIGQVVPTNPAAAVRGPKHVVKTGKTPVLEGAEWRKLLDIDPGHDLARSARPGIDCNAHLFLRADQRGPENEGRRSAIARCRLDDPAA